MRVHVFPTRTWSTDNNYHHQSKSWAVALLYAKHVKDLGKPHCSFRAAMERDETPKLIRCTTVRSPKLCASHAGQNIYVAHVPRMNLNGFPEIWSFQRTQDLHWRVVLRPCDSWPCDSRNLYSGRETNALALCLGSTRAFCLRPRLLFPYRRSDKSKRALDYVSFRIWGST